MGRVFWAPEDAPSPLEEGRHLTPQTPGVSTFSEEVFPLSDREQVSDAGHARTCPTNLLQCPFLPHLEVKKDWAVN